MRTRTTSRILARVTALDLGALVARLRPLALRWARAHVPPQDVEDVTQEALAILVKRAPSLPPGAVVAFLRVTVWRVASSQRRRVKALVGAPEVPSLARGPEDTLASAEVTAEVRAALARMPESRRRVVVEVLGEGQKVSDVARELDAPESTVRTRLAADVENLRATLHRRRVAEEGKGGFRSWCIAVVALLHPRALWRRIKTVRAALAVAFGVPAVLVAASGGAPSHIEPSPDEALVRVVEVEPLRWASSDARAERGRDAQPFKNPEQLPRARHDAGKRFRDERFGR